MEGVKDPSHYALMDGYSADDVMKACMTSDEYRGYWRGCAIKYLVRLGRKGNEDDARKDAHKAAECARRMAACYE